MLKFSKKIQESSGFLKLGRFSLGLDFHGVVDSLPDFFSFLTDSIVKNGGNVHIITGGSWDSKLEEQLNTFGINYTHKFSVYDTLLNNGTKIVGKIEFPDGTFQNKFENGSWDAIKANYCKENNINLHIDDTLIYNDFFETPFCRFWSHNNKPKASHKDLRHLD